jgi:hypothetical protein
MPSHRVGKRVTGADIATHASRTAFGSSSRAGQWKFPTRVAMSATGNKGHDPGDSISLNLRDFRWAPPDHRDRQLTCSSPWRHPHGKVSSIRMKLPNLYQGQPQPQALTLTTFCRGSLTGVPARSLHTGHRQRDTDAGRQAHGKVRQLRLEKGKLHKQETFNEHLSSTIEIAQGVPQDSQRLQPHFLRCC